MAEEAHSTVADGLKSPSIAWECPLFPSVIEAWFGRPAPEIVQLWFDQDAENHSPYVYFAQRSTDHAIKIGYTTNLSMRIRVLACASKCEIEILATAPGARCLENVYHAAFGDHHISGEWFHPAPEILAEIDRLNSAASGKPGHCNGVIMCGEGKR